jgi:capsular polysaccharide biosynthesis protein
MTQLDLPQLSLQRYVDLVKRRRWQLVPVSLLGLVTGALIAFLIPRYFVAETLLVHQQDPGQDVRNVENPLRSIVDSARITIPLSAGKVMEELKWPEALVGDAFERTRAELEVQKRIDVSDVNYGDKNRAYAQIKVSYRDRDGERAAKFLNVLVKTWAEKRINDLREPAERQHRDATDVASRLRIQIETLLADKQALERQYRIEPNVDLTTQRADLLKRRTAQFELAEALRTKEGQRAGLEALLQQKRTRLATMPARVQPALGRLEEVASQSPQGKLLLQRLVGYRLEMEVTWRENTAQWRAAKRAYEESMRQLQQIVPQAAVDADGLVPSPEYEALRTEIVQSEAAVTALDAELKVLRSQVDEESRRLEALIVGFPQYETKLREIDEALEARKAALAEQQRAKEVLAALTRELPVQQAREAQVPPRPTEPNILVVALIGSVLGLGVAIALILLLDFVQGTFKTIDEVERGLAVPVLGGMSHLETEEQRVAATRGRRRVSFVAASVLTLATVVVTIFYVDPTRLPPVVRDLLAMLLGG